MKATFPAPSDDSPLLKSLGLLVRARRESNGWSRRELAERSGLSERFLADLEAGVGNIAVTRLESVAHALGSTAGDLLHGAEQVLRGTYVSGTAGLAASVTDLLAGLSRDELAEAQRWLKARFGGGDGPLVALVGLRGAGKSSVGRALAQRLSLPFVELDELVERAAGLSLAGIFQLHGEAYYRRLAREVLTRYLAETDAAVIATGGGIVTDREAWRLLQKRCRTVWLRATPEDHWNRVLAQGDERPSAGSPHAMEELRAVLRAREPLYAQAELAVDTSALGLDGAVTQLAGALQHARPRAE